MTSWAIAQPPQQSLRVGLTPVFLDDRIGVLRRWASHLEATLGQSIRWVQFSSYSQIVDALRGAQLDFAWICGYPYVRERSHLALVSVPLWRGKPLYQSYLIADRASSIRTIDDLRGRVFAYSDPLSNSGFLYPNFRLRSRGFDPGRMFRRSFFTYSHRHVVDAVAQGLAEAGAVDGYIWEALAELAPAAVGQTRILEKSPDFGFPPFVAPRSTPPGLVARFAAALERMPASELGRAVLAELRLDGFTSVSPGLFDGIAAMARDGSGPS
ncbi:MAG: PhnD/SsuA/transferrin family substrate-binding protein [Casimicrobiaceae bacterium]